MWRCGRSDARRSFFEETEPKIFYFDGFKVVPAVQTNEIKVFCFFFSKKKALLSA